MEYVVCFGISTAFAFFANKTKNRFACVLLSAMSILVMVLLAGLRDYSIGVDTNNYLTMARFWAGAKKSTTFLGYMRYYMSLGYNEPLFALLVGLTEHFTGNFTVFLLSAHLVIITGVYIGAYRHREHVNPALVLLLFYLCYFNHSLNITRQYMAMSIIFAASVDIQEKKYLRFFIVVLIARFIHTSALLALGSVLIHWCLNGKFAQFAASLRPSTRARTLFVVGGLSALVFVFPWLCQMLINTGILNAKYQFFLNSEEAEYSVLITLVLLVEMFAIFVFRKQLRRVSPWYRYYLVSSICYLILQQLSLVIVYGKRIAAYYSLANLVTLAMIPTSFKEKQNRIIATVLVVLVVFAYWWYTYVLRNGSDTYPYMLVFG